MMFPYNRLNEIFDYVRQDNIVSASQLSVLLNITDRTIRSDIQAINEILEKNGAKIKLKRKAGYYIEINDQEKYNTFLSSIKQTKSNNPASFDTRSISLKLQFLIVKISSPYPLFNNLSLVFTLSIGSISKAYI